jgi:hypothetical protein
MTCFLKTCQSLGFLLMACILVRLTTLAISSNLLGKRVFVSEALDYSTVFLAFLPPAKTFFVFAFGSSPTPCYRGANFSTRTAGTTTSGACLIVRAA